MHRFERINIIIDSAEIHFPKGYFFKLSALHTTKKIAAQDILEINLNTHPPSLVYNQNEVIFVKPELEIEVQQFAERNGIPIVDRLDIWEHINRPYLDTEFEQEDELASLKLLVENGFSEEEVFKIRKKAGRTMFLNFIAWEWIYLGLFDYLNWTFLTKKKYWWAMEIALRNYKL